MLCLIMLIVGCVTSGRPKQAVQPQPQVVYAYPPNYQASPQVQQQVYSPSVNQKFCGACGAPAGKDLIFCGRCGKKFPE